MKNKTYLFGFIGLCLLLLATAFTNLEANSRGLQISENTIQNEPVSINALPSDSLLIHGVVSPAIQSVTVVLIDGNGTWIDGTRPDSDGRWSFSNVLDGIYTLGVLDDNNEPVTLENNYLVDRDNAHQPFFIELPSTAASRSMDNNGIIEVTVKKGDTDEFFSSATVMLYDTTLNSPVYGYFSYSEFDETVYKATFSSLDTTSSYKIFTHPDNSSQYLSEFFDGHYTLSQTNEDNYTEITFENGEVLKEIEVTLDRSGVISGEIVDALTNTTLSGEYFTLYPSSSSYSEFTFDGTFLFNSSLYGQTISITVNTDSFSQYAPTTVQVDSTQGTTQTIQIPLQRSASIAGQVKTPEGTPLGSTRVTLYDEDGSVIRESFSENDDGTFFITGGLGTGIYYLKAAKACLDTDDCYGEGFHGGAKSIDDATPISVTAAQTTTANIVLSKLSVIRGTVVANGNQFIESYVTLSNANDNPPYVIDSFTLSAGQFEEFVFTVEPGEYLFSAEPTDPNSPYIYTYWQSQGYDDANTLEIGEDEEVNNVVITLREGATINGTATSKSTGEAFPNINILLVPPGGINPFGAISAQTDENGNFEFTRVIPNTYTLYIESYEDFESYESEPFTIQAGQTLQKDIEVIPFAKVSGQVVDAGTGLGIYDASFDLSNFYTSERTDTNGEFELTFDTRGIPSSKIELEVIAPCFYDENSFEYVCPYANEVVELDIQNGEVLSDLVIELDKKGLLSISVSDEITQNPLESSITIYKDDTSNYPILNMTCGGYGSSSCETYDGINYEIYVDPGTYFVQARSTGYVTEFYDDADADTATPIVVGSNQEVTVDVNLYQGDQLSGKVVDSATGQPISDIAIKLIDPKNEST
ncbi:MAG: carboxypeptidase regulatory-like domain-containing protein, partial [Chloroflexota bacterium]